MGTTSGCDRKVYDAVKEYPAENAYTFLVLLYEVDSYRPILERANSKIEADNLAKVRVAQGFQRAEIYKDLGWFSLPQEG